MTVITWSTSIASSLQCLSQNIKTTSAQWLTSITSVLVKHCTVIELKLSICKSYKCDHQLVPFAFSHCIGLPYWTWVTSVLKYTHLFLLYWRTILFWDPGNKWKRSEFLRGKNIRDVTMTYVSHFWLDKNAKSYHLLFSYLTTFLLFSLYIVSAQAFLLLQKIFRFVFFYFFRSCFLNDTENTHLWS